MSTANDELSTTQPLWRVPLTRTPVDDLLEREYLLNALPYGKFVFPVRAIPVLVQFSDTVSRPLMMWYLS